MEFEGAILNKILPIFIRFKEVGRTNNSKGPLRHCVTPPLKRGEIKIIQQLSTHV